MLEEQNSFVDCRSDVLPVKKSGPIATCRYPSTLFRNTYPSYFTPDFVQTIFRYDTRVDYVYRHQSVQQIWEVDHVDHLETDASVHNAVQVTFKRVL